MEKKNVLLICGGGGSEHLISKKSAQYLLNKLNLIPTITPYYLCIEPNGDRTNIDGQKCELRKAGEVYNRETDQTIKLDYAIPCIHGPPGENGQIQSVFDLMGLPYLGAGPQASLNCFNKVTTKLWLSSAEIKNVPYTYLVDAKSESIAKAKAFFNKSGGSVFIKAASQGSSVGCFKSETEESLKENIAAAFKYSSYVLIEKAIQGRELEVAVFEHDKEIVATMPGEITCSSAFYDYEEKYNPESKAETHVEARDMSETQLATIQETAIKSFKLMKIKDLARIDFFLSQEGEIFVNEINTFPGHTDISMFPMMLEHTGLKYEDFLRQRIHQD